MNTLVFGNTEISDDTPTDYTWLRYFDPRAALAAVAAHIEKLPSSRTEERHTARSYRASLNLFLDWSQNVLPTEELMNRFVAHLVRDRHLRTATISRYLAPVRLYLRKLAAQRVGGFAGLERDFIADCREHLRAAAEVRTPPPDLTTNVAPLWNPNFIRLSLQQVNAVLRSIDRSTVAGLRDYALLHIAFSTALRLSELGRITQSAISYQQNAILLTVRGKRNNLDPVPISPKGQEDLKAAVDGFNDGLPAKDRRRIQLTYPVWQPLSRTGDYLQIGVNGYTPARGLSNGGIRNIIARRTAAALGEQFALAAHDTRRTAAALAHEAGMALPDIQALLRHKDGDVTLRYIGVKPNYDSRTLGRYLWFG